MLKFMYLYKKNKGFLNLKITRHKEFVFYELVLSL